MDGLIHSQCHKGISFLCVIKYMGNGSELNMVRGTTPTLEFTLPFSTDILAEAYVTLSQNKKVVVDKPLVELERNGNKLSVKLTQAETLLLDSERKTEIQVRVRTLENEALASDIITVNTDRVLKDGVI